MFPENPLYQLGKDLAMFVVHDNIVYHAKSEARNPRGNFLYFCKRYFPLVKSDSLMNIEQGYAIENQYLFEKFQNEYASSLKSNENALQQLNDELRKNRILHFWMSKVIPAYCNIKNEEFSACEEKEKNNSSSSILEALLGSNAVVIDNIIYPLAEIGKPSIVHVCGKDYCWGPSKMGGNKMEREFQHILEGKLKRETLSKMDFSDSLKKEIFELEENIRICSTNPNHIIKAGACFEYGDIGYDPDSQKVYYLLQPHHNHSNSKDYGPRLGAIAVGATENKLDTSLQLLGRSSPNSKFNVDVETSGLCLGISVNNTSVKGIVAFLYKVANNIYVQKKHHG